jgi:hypothetical protein
MSITTESRHEVVVPTRRGGRAVAGGLAGVVLGALLGLIVGANIGGNWFTSFSFAGQRGYEATSLIGAVAGAVLLGAVGVWLALRGRSRRRVGG